MTFRPLIVGMAMFISGSQPALCQPTNRPVVFQEVYDLLATNLAGFTPSQLDTAAAQGLIAGLGPRVSLLPEPARTGTNPPAPFRSALFDGYYGYIRPGNIGPDSPGQFAEAWKSLSSSNRLKGLVLDLRYGSGTDLAAAAGIADLFFGGERPMIDYGKGVQSSTPKNNALQVPVALLINDKTAGAAEALAAILRDADVGLLLGKHTAGDISIHRIFPLSTGQRLRVAIAPVKVGKGHEVPTTGIKPDVAITVSAEDELAYFDNAYKELRKSLAQSGSTNPTLMPTNRPNGRRVKNEAELMRMLREGENPEQDAAARARDALDPSRPIIHDPVLARGLDLLKGLTVVRQYRSL